MKYFPKKFNQFSIDSIEQSHYGMLILNLNTFPNYLRPAMSSQTNKKVIEPNTLRAAKHALSQALLTKKACEAASARVWYLEPKWLRYLFLLSMCIILFEILYVALLHTWFSKSMITHLWNPEWGEMLSENMKNMRYRSYADLNRDRWIQSPEC